MKVNLKKAAAIQEQVLKKINTLKPRSSFSLDVYTDQSKIPDIIIEHKEKFTEAVNNVRELYHVYYSIRSKVSEANSDSGISQALCQYHELKQVIAMYSGYQSETTYDIDAVIAKAKSASEKTTASYMTSDTLSVSCISGEMKESIQACLNDFNLQLNKVCDKLSELNYTDKIVLNDHEVDVLKSNNII